MQECSDSFVDGIAEGSSSGWFLLIPITYTFGSIIVVILFLSYPLQLVVITSKTLIYRNTRFCFNFLPINSRPLVFVKLFTFTVVFGNRVLAAVSISLCTISVFTTSAVSVALVQNCLVTFLWFRHQPSSSSSSLDFTSSNSGLHNFQFSSVLLLFSFLAISIFSDFTNSDTFWFPARPSEFEFQSRHKFMMVLSLCISGAVSWFPGLR